MALAEGDQGWILVDEGQGRVLGRALAWADNRSIGRLHLLADEGAGVLARQVACFTEGPRVWRVDRRQVVPAVPDRHTSPPPPPESALDLVHVLTDAGLDVVIEHGQVRGEVLGLEVAAIVVDDDGPARIEIGVGRHDREAFALVHGDVPTETALETVVRTVRKHRVAGSGHPLGRLAPERWLRAVVLAEPSLAGAVALEPVEATTPRGSVKDPAPAFAAGTGRDGEAMLVACSVGIDLDLVPAAADARELHAPDATLVLALPARDDHPVTRRLAGRLVRPGRVVQVDDRFRA